MYAAVPAHVTSTPNRMSVAMMSQVRAGVPPSFRTHTMRGSHRRVERGRKRQEREERRRRKEKGGERGSYLKEPGGHGTAGHPVVWGHVPHDRTGGGGRALEHKITPSVRATRNTQCYMQQKHNA